MMMKLLPFAALLLAGCFPCVIRYDREAEQAFVEAYENGDPLARHACYCYRQARIARHISWAGLPIGLTAMLFIPNTHTMEYPPSRDYDKLTVEEQIPGIIAAVSLGEWISGMVYSSVQLMNGNRAKRRWFRLYIEEKRSKQEVAPNKG
jgi:hypothetical protein